MPYIASWLEELGFCKSNGMGISGLEWLDIECWQKLTGKQLRPWESVALKRASEAYAVVWTNAKDASYPSPWQEHEIDPQILQDQIKAVFDSIISSQHSKGKK